MELDSISVRAQPNPEDNPKTNPETTKQESTVTCSPPEDESTASPPTEKATEEPSRCYPPTTLKIIIITALCLGTLLDAIDITIIGVAIPTISTHFHALEVGWYGSAYLITLTALQPIFGVTYKFFNPKTIYLSSILVFEAGSIICASAPSSAVFILGRAICGCGGAGILQGALCIVALTVPLNKRALYLGIVVSSFGAAACFGPIMGGALTDRVSWRWCFWINLPVGAVVAGIIVLVLRLEGVEDGERALPLGKKLRRLDPVGACLLIASVCCLVLALQWGGSILPWRSAKVIGLLVGFGLLGIAFFVFEWRIGETAMLPMRVFGQRSVLMGCFYVCFLQMLNDSDTYYMPFYFQAAQDASATLSGAKYLALIIPEIVTIVITGAIVSKTGYYVPYMIVGACIAAIGSGLLTRIALGTPTVEWASYLVISGLGIGLGLNLPYTALHVVLRYINPKALTRNVINTVVAKRIYLLAMVIFPNTHYTINNFR